ncbi:Flap endonuclease GEN [Ooceraea biroi]|uniref:Flap endonuclease GEN n=1 Tax=Ooceraea biroi TaxID=2015173 RepID=A0A026W9V1_OOCBI|nr:Flap endonuclease GEN [Ooceraea biroi]
MGVKDLWNILSPLCDRKPLYELQGKTIAIDLSGWVVDSQTIIDNAVQPKMYLRNLYFRTAFLLMQGIFPVFVLEGKAPVLKHKTIARRNDARNGSREGKTARKGGRMQFNRVLNECRQMLQYMGIACVQGQGEAEAMCAYLNEDGLVDGCISQDSDCFLYGARIVYRNFSTSTQGAAGGSVDVYSMEKIEKVLSIGRNKMIALALLCGCDYDEGVSGVGKEAALKFFKIVEDQDVLQRIQQWGNDASLDRAERDLARPDLCTSCGHRGKIQKHAKSGCTDCGTVSKCNNDFREKRTLILNEVSLRKKALQDENFPSRELIEEFLTRKDQVPTKLDIEWQQPQINQFVDFMNKHLCWEPQYAFEKIFTLTTRWQLVHLSDLALDERSSIPDLFIPDKIKKIRKIRSVASYEIIWKKEHSAIEMLKRYKELEQKDDDDDGIDDDLLTSIESQDLVSKCYPELVEAFETSRNVNTKKRTAASRRKKTNIEKTGADAAKSRQKTTKKILESKNNRKIEEFISENCPISLEDSFEKMAITPKRSKRGKAPTQINKLRVKSAAENVAIVDAKQMKRGPQFRRVLETERVNSRLNNTVDRMFNELSPDDFMSENEDDEDDMNITDVIENICSKQTFQFELIDSQPTKSTGGSTENVTEECTKTDEFLALIEEQVHAENKEEGLALAENEEEESDDEFGDINDSYIPINQRIQIGENEKLLQTCCYIEKKSNVNFEDLMNETNNGSMHLET